jgi:carbon storage regulator
MLVLTRRVGEEIVIAGHIRIRVTKVQGDRVRLGIIAPEEVYVDRAEVHERRDSSGPPVRPASNPRPQVYPGCSNDRNPG